MQSTPSISYRPQHHNRRCNFDSFVHKRGAKAQNRPPLVFSLHKTLPNFQTLALLLLLLLPLRSSVPFVPVLFRKRLEELVRRRRAFKLCNTSLLTGKYISFVKRKILFMFPVSVCEFFLPEGLELREDVSRWKMFFFSLSNLFVYGFVSRL